MDFRGMQKIENERCYVIENLFKGKQNIFSYLWLKITNATPNKAHENPKGHPTVTP